MEELLANPSRYHLRLVKVSSMRRQASLVFDFENIKVPLTVGFLTTDNRPLAQLIRSAVERGKELLENPDPSLLKSFMQPTGRSVGVFSFDYDYWLEAQTETNGIFISPGPIFDKIKKIFPVRSELIQPDKSLPVIYDVKKELIYTEESLENVLSNPSGYRDKIVRLQVNEFGGKLSVQEVIKQAGLTIPVDVSLEGSINWENLPTSMQNILLAVGATNEPQDKIVEPFHGRYSIVGRIVTTGQIDESWPEYPLLLIYGKERIGGIDWAGLAAPAKEFVENQLAKLYWTLSRFHGGRVSGLKVAPPEGIISILNPSQIPEIVPAVKKLEFLIRSVTRERPLELNVENNVKILVNFKQALENVSISFRKVPENELSVPKPENFVTYSYFEIQLGTTVENIENACLSFSVAKDWLARQKARKETVKLLRYFRGCWENLKTRLELENETHYLYSAEVPGFSVFSIVASPGAEGKAPSRLPLILLAILGIGIGGGVVALRRYLIARRVPVIVPKFCKKCGTPLTAGVKFCKKCGTPIPRPAIPAKYCRKCGAPIAATASFCSKCGTKLRED
ncbi:MAG: PGF-pre-PGF domain-containing protein [Candidatus Hadarchaeales archaeon]